MKKYNIIISVLSFLGIVIAGYFLCRPDAEFVCEGILSWMYPPVILMSASIFLISLMLFFLRQEVFRSWFNFFVWFLPLSIFLISIAPEYSNDIIAPFDKKLTSWWLASIFFLISLLIIGIKSWKLRRR